MVNRKKIILLLTVSFSFFVTSAQKLWSIEDCISWAVEHNISIQQSQVRVEQGQINVQSAKWAYAPTLSANAGYNLNAGRSLDQTTYEYTNNNAHSASSNVSLSTQLFAGMKKLYNLQKSEIDLKALIATKEQLQRDITVQVAVSYLQVLFNKEQINNAINQLEASQSQLENTKKLVEAGSQPLSAQLEIEAQVATEEYNLVSYRNTLATNLLTLRQLLELPYEMDFDVVVPFIPNLDSIIITDFHEINNVAQDFIPSVKSAEFQFESAVKSVKIAKAGYYPTISFSANYGSSWNSTRKRYVQVGEEIIEETYPLMDQFVDNRSGGLSFNLNIPIFNTLTQRRAVQTSKWNQTNAQLELMSTKNELYKEIQQAYVDATGALEQFHSAEKSVQSLAMSFDITSKKFSVGAATSTDYIQSKNNLTNAENTLVQAKYTYLFRAKILDYYKDIPIRF